MFQSTRRTASARSLSLLVRDPFYFAPNGRARVVLCWVWSVCALDVGIGRQGMHTRRYTLARRESGEGVCRRGRPSCGKSKGPGTLGDYQDGSPAFFLRMQANVSYSMFCAVCLCLCTVFGFPCSCCLLVAFTPLQPVRSRRSEQTAACRTFRLVPRRISVPCRAGPTCPPAPFP